jgi:predicted DNA-binding antitoxin AbrB/MazE fold protein
MDSTGRVGGMSKPIPAIFENGVFKPQAPVALENGTRVEIMLPSDAPSNDAEMRKRFPNSWGVLSDDEADRISKAIDETCGQIDPDAWR